MRARALVVLLLLAGPALGGCIGSSDEDLSPTSDPQVPQGAWTDPVAALESGEPSANVDLLSEWRDGGGQEADSWGDYLFVDQGAAIVILDVSEPRAIEEVGRWTGPATPVDVKVSDDGQYLFIGDDAEGSTAATGGTGPFTGGFYVLDVSDKAHPELVTFLQVGPQRGPHMVAYHQTADGRELLFGAAGPDVVIAEFDRGAGELTELARYTPGQLAQDRHPNRIGALYNPQGWVHDMFVMEDGGDVRMYVAAWDAGLRVVDVTDPGAPEEVGAWNDFGENEAGNLHTVATAWVGETRITVGAVEVGFAVVGGTYYATGSEKPALYVWDTTDPSNVELLGTWVNPIKQTTGRDQVPGEQVDSTHNLQLEQGRVYLAHYALGAWVLDVSSPANQSEPALLGYYNEDDMDVWDVVLHQGVLYTSGATGVLGLHYLEDVVGDDGVTSRA